MKNLVLFRKNLRICDNPALFKACEDGMILPVYLHDDNSLNRPLGAASKYWLHHALKSLDNDLNNWLLKESFNPGDVIYVEKNKNTNIIADQSYSERQLFEKAYERLKSEFEAVLKVKPEDVQKKMDKALGRTQNIEELK